MQHPQRQPNTNVIRNDSIEFGPVTIEANGSQRLPLGRYRKSEPEPQFNVHYEPAVPQIVTHEIIRLPVDDGRSYQLYCHFQNFYDHDVTVKVERQFAT